MTTPVSRRMVEVPGSEALWLLEGGAQGHVVYVRREIPVVRPAVHILEYGRLIVRTPAQATALACSTIAHLSRGRDQDDGRDRLDRDRHGTCRDHHRSGRSGHYRRTLPGWAHGPHDTLVRIHPQTVTGFRLAHAEAVR